VVRSGRRFWGQWAAKLALAFFSVLFLYGVSGPAEARTAAPAQGEDVVALGELPPQARQTWRLIMSGGPFPYEKDGTTFFNRERLLPSQKRGYYREYTVKTPGARNRGARRIVCGGKEPTRPDSCYYTADHYASFRRITQ
jgi:ribonuclease T1